MAVRVTQAQLERAVGGAKKLLQLVDKDDTGDLSHATCQAFIAEILAEGNGDVNGYISPAVDVSDTSLDTAPMLVRYEVAIDAYLAWLKGTGGIGIPEKIEAEYEHAVEQLEKIGNRRKGIGLLTRPNSGQPVQQVTKSDVDEWFSPLGPRRRFDGWS
jgi:hypothetical protein